MRSERLPIHFMSRAVIAEAVLKNIFYFFDNTKSLRKGSVISCRNFLLAVCFHKHSFPQGSYIVRLTNMKSKELLKHICYKPFAQACPSNYWGKRTVSILLFSVMSQQKDIIFQHVKGPGLHSFVEQPNGVKKYVRSPQAQCRSHQRHFMKNTTTALYKHFLQMYPSKGVSFVQETVLLHTVLIHSLL